jgi:hypothetical protein
LECSHRAQEGPNRLEKVLQCTNRLVGRVKVFERTPRFKAIDVGIDRRNVSSKVINAST